MPKRQNIDFAHLDYRALNGEQRARLLRQAMEQAHVERSETLWRMIAVFAARLRRAAAGLAEWRAHYRRRRWQQADAAALSTLNDRTLKDIGVARCEINRLAATGRRRAA